MHFWKGAKFAGSVGHPMTTMLSAPWTPLGALPPDPRYRLVLRTRHGAPQPLTPSAAYDPLEKILRAPLVSINSRDVVSVSRLSRGLKTSRLGLGLFHVVGGTHR